MGLSIHAYRGLTKAAPGEGTSPGYPDDPDGYDYERGYMRFYVHPDFPGRADGIEDWVIYGSEEKSEPVHWSYSGYGTWRDQLADLAGYPRSFHPHHSYAASVWNEPKVGPFMELINFADNEGTIGAAVSAKLAKDFAEFQSKADAHPDDWFVQQYAAARRVFEMAADRGAVYFG